jgi:hypothetical protein
MSFLETCLFLLFSTSTVICCSVIFFLVGFFFCIWIVSKNKFVISTDNIQEFKLKLREILEKEKLFDEDGRFVVIK